MKKRMRFPSACLAAVVLAATPAAFAQTSAVEPARIDDIQVSQDGETFSILVKLSQQPASATARVEGDDLVLDLNGLSLAKLVLEPSPGSMIRHVEAAHGRLKLSGAAFGEASAVIYRNAVVVKTKLAEPKAGGSSLMAAKPIVPKEPPPAPPEAKQVVAFVESAPTPAPAVVSITAKDHPG
jgi:hypothetical protein